MAKRKERFLLKINAIIVALLGMMGCNSCSYYVKYGVPDFPYNDTTGIDTTIRAMYGVMPVLMYGVQGGEWAPQRAPEVPEDAPEAQKEPEVSKDNENK